MFHHGHMTQMQRTARGLAHHGARWRHSMALGRDPERTVIPPERRPAPAGAGRLASRPAYAAAVVGLAAGYFLLGRGGLAVGALRGQIAPVWPASGLALGALLLLGRRLWPGVFLGALAVGLSGAIPAAAALGVAAGSTLAALAGVTLLARVDFHPALERTRDVVALTFLGAGLATLLGAGIQVASLRLAGVVPAGAAPAGLPVAWLGAGLGVVVVAPPILTAGSGVWRRRPGATRLQAILFFAALGILFVGILTTRSLYPYGAFPLVIWAVARYQQRGAAVGGVLVAVGAIAATITGRGPFAGKGTIAHELWLVDGFLVVMVLTMLVLAAVVAERDQVRVELEQANADLDRRVRQRTAQLERERENLAEAQRIAGLGSWEWDLAGGTVSLSEELARLYGLSPGPVEVTWGEYLAAVHPDDRPAVEAALDAAREDRQPFTFDHRIVVTDGSVRWLHAGGQVVTAADGMPERLRGTEQDITDRRRADLKFKGLLEAAPDAIVVVDAGGTIRLVNRQTEALFGYPRSELLGARLEKLVPPRVRAQHPTLRVGYFHDPRARPMGAGLELTACRRDGTEFPVDVSLSPLETEEGLLVSAAIRDVTERKRAESALKESEQRRDLALESARMGSWDLDLRAGTSVRSLRHDQIFGYDTPLEDWSLDAFLAHVVPDQRDGVRQIFEEAFDSGRFKLQCQIRWPEGSLHWIETQGLVFRGSDGDPERMMALVSDTTEPKRLEEELQAALREAIEASQLKSQFLANMSHEIRTPMNGVLGLARLLLNTGLNAEQARYAEALRDSGQNLLAIINDILDFSKVEAGKLELETIDFDLPGVLGPVFELMRGRALGKGLAFTLDLHPDLLRRLSGDPVRLRQILTNLIDNAIKFTDAGSVTVAAAPVPGGVRFEVADTGMGIDPGARETILDPFTQADASTTRRFGGTGLGLAISRQLVELMGGTFDFASEPSMGSRFWFELPLRPPDGRANRPAGGEGAQGLPAMRAAAAPAGRVLLVEDSEINQMVAVGMLEHLGFEVDLAVNGSDAITAAAGGAYDAILMDCLMPVMDGYEATAHIRSLAGPASRTPIIAVTASAMPADRERCLAAGMDEHVSKPLDPVALAGALARCRVARHPSRLAGGGGTTDPGEDAEASSRPAAPPAPAANDGARTIDQLMLSRLRDLDGQGGEGFFREIIELFLADAPRRLAKLEAAVRSGNAAECARIAHSLKGSAANLGARGLAGACAALETLTEGGDLGEAPAAFALVRQRFERAREALIAEVAAPGAFA
jgi:PAS domain S-box-containing protein